MNVRLVVVRLLQRVLAEGVSLSDALPHAQSQVVEKDQARVQALSFGVIRWHYRLQAILNQCLQKPLKKKDQDIISALELGLYELLAGQSPAYAVIQQTAELARVLKKPWAVKLINGVLRHIQRHGAELQAQADQDEASRHALPDWLYRRLAKAYAGNLNEVLEAINAHPPMTLRVNLDRLSRQDYQSKLTELGMHCSAHPCVASAIVLSQPVDVSLLPGFAEGWVSVQDAAAQLAATFLAPKPGHRLLDACAAPGGKTLHLLEHTHGKCDLLALDNDPQRLLRVGENLSREQYQATLLAADAGDPTSWFNGQCFDRILLDAPCSGTGVLRRHPDIKILRRDSDIAPLAAQQQRLLEALWPLLAPGGMLLYVTCSLLPEENVMQVERFLRSEPSAQLMALPLDWQRPNSIGRQIQIGENDMDGFYYARMQKCP